MILRAFRGVTLSQVRISGEPHWRLSPLSETQKCILKLLGVSSRTFSKLIPTISETDFQITRTVSHNGPLEGIFVRPDRDPLTRFRELRANFRGLLSLAKVRLSFFPYTYRHLVLTFNLPLLTIPRVPLVGRRTFEK